MIHAFAVMAYFAHIQPALLGEERRVDHVHRVRIAAHQPRQHRAGDRLGIELGCRAFNLDRDLVEVAVGQLADQAAKLFGQRHIGPQLGRFFGRERGHVERIGNPAIDQIVR